VTTLDPAILAAIVIRYAAYVKGACAEYPNDNRRATRTDLLFVLPAGVSVKPPFPVVSNN
jgi:hypothetical protein